MKRLFLLLVMFISVELYAQPTLSVSEYATGFTRPVSIKHANDDRLFIVEQAGIIKIIDETGVTLTTPFLDIRDSVNDGHNEQGLLGLAFPPDYQTSGTFYVYYTGGNNEGFSNISRFQTDPNNPNLALRATEEVILTFSQPYLNHNGGDLHFGPDGFLYIGTGDGGSAGDPQNRAQNRNLYLGKILRLDVDTVASYKIPDDNPFVGQNNRKEEIWSWGLRNPWRYSFDRVTGDMWIGDVGQQAREEVDFQAANTPGGVNYGWRCFEGNIGFLNIGCNNDYTFPVFNYPHNNNQGGFSITGGYVYRGSEMPNFVGNYVCADYVTGHFWTISPEDNTEEYITNRQNNVLLNVSTFGEDKAGEIYIGKLLSGEIYKLVATCPDSTINLSIEINGDSIVSNATAGELVWLKDGNEISGENGSAILLQGTGNYQLELSINNRGCHYASISNVIEFVDCSDTILDVQLTLENDTIKSNFETGTFVWYFNGQVISEDQPFHIPLETGEYYVEITKEEECTLFGRSDTITTQCGIILCDPEIVFGGTSISSYCTFGRIIWFLDGVPIDTVFQDNASYIPTVSGMYSLTAYDSIAPYCVITGSAGPINVVISNVFNNSAKEIKLFPNPASKLIHAEFSVNNAIQLKNIVLYNLEGKQEQLSAVIRGNILEIDVSKLNAGVYILEVNALDGKYIGKILKE